jgi:Barstar (barnase inhibitor)
MPVVEVPTQRIRDWDAFHDVFAEILGFPDFYGRNLNAWIDCVADADNPSSEMMSTGVEPGDVLTLQLGLVSEFAKRCPEQYAAIVECAAFVNWSRIETGNRPIVALSFYA